MEVLGLTWGDVDTKAGTIRVRFQLSRTPGGGRVPVKTDEANREVDISPELASMLREFRAACLFSQDTDYLFHTETGQPLGWSNVDRYALGSAVKAAKLSEPAPRFHDLRHTFASMLIADGADVEYVRGQLGHADAAITLRVYTHAFGRQRLPPSRARRWASGLETSWKHHPSGTSRKRSPLR